MYIFRVREYANNDKPANSNCNPKFKLEAVGEGAIRAAEYEKDRIYFYADLTTPEDL